MGDDQPLILHNVHFNFDDDDDDDHDRDVGFHSNGPILKQDPFQIARQYQLDLSKRAVDENVIVVLETGCGKTLIAILLMCYMEHLIKKPNKNVCVFLAPTVALVHQQANVIEQFTDFKVTIICGDAKHLKTHSAWEREREQHEVLVMTPQVLLRSLCHCFIRMETIELLIFDECHHAQLEKNHPYAQIMKVFYKTELAKLPRVLGMTASPINGKGASINSLEALLHAKVYTVINKDELEAVAVSPVVQVYHYRSNTEVLVSSHQKCLDKLEEIKRQCISVLCRTLDDPKRLQSSKKLLQRLHNNIVFSLTSLGLWGASQACRILLSGDSSERNDLMEAKANTHDDLLQNEYLVQTASLFGAECIGDVADGIASGMSCTKVLKEPFFSQKVLRLIEILSEFRSRPDMKCIIFVNRIIVARSLSYIIGKSKILSAWKCDFLVGVHSGLKRMSRKTMNHILEEFQSGKLNLLVATKVGEEGLDIQTCCLVIRFDLPETLASFIQSRGRARMPQSEYAFLVDSENEREMQLMESFEKAEDLMNMDIKNRKSDGVVPNIQEEVYTVDSTGATISAQTSVTLLHHYCSRLPRDEYFSPRLDLFYVDDAEGTICHIILPCNAPIHHVVSAPQSSIEAAKKDACLKACRELHRVGALTEYLLPEVDDVDDESSLDGPDLDGSEDDDSPFELQEMLVPAALKEPWSDVDKYVYLNSYCIRFTPIPHDRQYKDFGFFVKAPLPCEAESMKIDLHLSFGRSVLTDLVPAGVSEFDEEEMLMAQKFQEMFFKIILDRSEFMHSHVPLKHHQFSESNYSFVYLLLPIFRQKYKNTLSVDWTTIRRCLSSPIFKRPTGIVDSQIPLDGHLHLADGPTAVNVILNSLVYVVHRKSFFFVSQILPDKNGYSLHNSTTRHIEHLSEKFGIHLAHPEQPLLQAKQLFCLHNLLHDRKKGNSDSQDLEEYFFELPPEVCHMKITGLSKEIGSSLSLLPSIMHRLQNLLVAIELKDILSKSFAEGALISAERVLEALTTEKCHERFSLERLEVLGDAFLKFAVGRHLFLKHEAFDEGQLTRRRSSVVNNSNLCKLAIKNKLQVYIRDQEFDPSQFYAPGHPCPIICTKQTEKSIHSYYEANLRCGTDSRQVRCSKNHHWLTKKTIADVVEALVGAYIIDGGFKAAIAFLRWIGIEAEFEVSQVCRAWIASANFLSVADRIDIPSIESFLGHNFAQKGLLLQAFIHPSYNRHGGGCYQRLEFLGDAVLDYLITSYIYSAYPDLKPGQLTDLRSSLVNNSSFARVAVSRSFHKFIICENSSLCDAINNYVNFLKKPTSERKLLQEPPCPKALGDLVESCIGAILLDAGFNLNHVWKVMLSFLDPIMSFSALQLSPIRELLELSQHHGWDVQFLPTKKNRSYMVEAIVDGKMFRATAAATDRSKRIAKRIAAQQVTAKLKAQGYKLKTKSLEEILKIIPKMEAKLVGYDEIPLAVDSSSALINVGNSSFVNPELYIANLSLEDHSSNSVSSDLNFASLSLDDRSRGYQILEPDVNLETKSVASFHKKSSREVSSFPKRREQSPTTVEGKISNDDSDAQDASRKSSAKSRLNEVCVANCLRPPLYECCKEEGPSHMKLFTFKVVVVIEDAENLVLECFGRPQAKKKVAAEEAADGALWFLKNEGYIHS